MAKNDKKVKLSPPWEAHMQMLNSFFKNDPRIKVVTETQNGEKGKVIGQVLVSDPDCEIALTKVLAGRVEFGNVTLIVEICSANEKVYTQVERKLKAGKKLTPLAALKIVLKGNPAFMKMKMGRMGDRTLCYCIFRPVVLQWYNDNLGNPWKISTSTYEEKALEVFANDVGAIYTTAPEVAQEVK